MKLIFRGDFQRELFAEGVTLDAGEFPEGEVNVFGADADALLRVDRQRLRVDRDEQLFPSRPVAAVLRFRSFRTPKPPIDRNALLHGHFIAIAHFSQVIAFRAITT